MENGKADQAIADQCVINSEVHEDTNKNKKNSNGNVCEAGNDQQRLLEDCVKNPSSSEVQSRCHPARLKFVTVEPVVCLVVIVFATIMNLRGQYIRQEIAETFGIVGRPGSYQSSCGNDTDDIRIDREIQSLTSKWVLRLSAASSFPSLFTVAFIGGLSDKFGRKMPMLLPVFGFLLSALMSMFIMVYDLPIDMFLVASFIEGITGGFALVCALSFAYIADVTTKKERTFRIVVIEMIFFLGAGLSQIAVGYLLQGCGYAVPMLIAQGLAALAIFYIITPCLLPETIPRNKNTTGGAARGRNGRDILRKLFLLFQNNKNKRRWIIVLSLSVVFMCTMITNGVTLITILYGLGQPFCWSSIFVGYFTAADLLSIGFGALLGAKLLPMFLSDIYILYVCMLDSVLNLIVVALSQNTTMLLLSCPVGFLKGLQVPILKSMMSKMVADDEQGTLFAILGISTAMGGFISPLLLNGIYSISVKFYPPLVFFVMIVMYAAPVIIVCVIHMFHKISAGKDIPDISSTPTNEESGNNVRTIN